MILREYAITLQGDMTNPCPTTEDDWDILLKWYNDPNILYFSEGDAISSNNLSSLKAFEKNSYRIDSKNKCAPGAKTAHYDLVISSDNYCSNQ